MNIIWIAASAFIGGIVASLLGWLESKEAFDARKFGASLIRSLVAGVGFAVAYQYSDGIQPVDLALAFLGGAGVDAGGHRIAGAIRARLK